LRHLDSEIEIEVDETKIRARQGCIAQRDVERDASELDTRGSSDSRVVCIAYLCFLRDFRPIRSWQISVLED